MDSINYSRWPWKVVIPSYNRHEYIINHSLALCDKFKIPHDFIYIFVATINNEKELYTQSLLNHSIAYRNIHIIEGPLGLKNMRNFITDYFNENEPLLCMDDDIDDLFILHEDNDHDKNKAGHWKLKSLTDKQFYDLTMKAYEIMLSKKLGLFGIYPVKNGFFMKDLPNITYDARFCVGAFWGIINNKSIILTLDEKEDMERSILFTIKDGGVLRFNNITLSTKYYRTPGGMQTHLEYNERIQNSIVSCKILYERFPELCKLYTSKKNSMCEIRFKPRPSKFSKV